MKKYFSPFLIALTFFIVGIITISDYGINWDAPFRMMRGKLFSRFYIGNLNETNNRLSPILIQAGEYASRYDFLDGEEGDLVSLPGRPQRKLEHRLDEQLKQKRYSFYNHIGVNKDFFLEYFRPGHPPMFDILAAFSNRIFYGVLGIFDDIPAYQVLYLFVSSIGVFIVGVFAFELTGAVIAGVVASGVIALYPLFLAEAHFNMKDPLQAVMFVGSIWAFWHWVKENKIFWAVLAATFLCLAANIKWNIGFVIFIITPWLILIRDTEAFKKWFSIKKYLLFSILTIVAFIVTMTVFAPNSWNDPLSYFIQRIDYYWTIGTRPDPLQPAGFLLPGSFNIYPLLLLLFQTPEIVLILVSIGLILYKKNIKDKLKTHILLGLWLLIPLVRVSLPHMWFYNGIRQIMEVIPVIAILSGIGAYILSEKLKRYFKYSPILISILVLILLLIPVWRYHPNQNLYFNSLAGGLKGAVNKNLVDKKISYGNIYKQAADWLNEHAEVNANVAFLDGPMYALSPVFLREDISTSPFYFSSYEQKGEYFLQLFDPINPMYFAQRYPKTFLKPVHEIKVDGMPMLIIYRNTPVQSRFDKTDEKIEKNFKLKRVLDVSKPYLEIDLGKDVLVTRIAIGKVSKNCPPHYTQYTDELIQFIPNKDYGFEHSDSNLMYSLQERRRNHKGQIELLFAGEESRYIRIYIQSGLSCFVGSNIDSVSYVE